VLKYQNPLLSLGERCVAFAEIELNNGVKEDHLNSYTSLRIREYFKVCTRLINGKETLVNLTAGNWCAASASFCMISSLLPGETAPHGCRLGVIEIVSDLQKNGLWRPIDKLKPYQIKVGDIVVFDRSQQGKPETAWWRHVGRVHSLDNSGFKCISGNSGGCWKISTHKYSQSNLLGFGEYPDFNSKTIANPSNSIDWSSIDISQLAPMEDTGKNLDSIFDIYEEIFNG
jgi:hypothetical protein